jgi:hypothetical protein
MVFSDGGAITRDCEEEITADYDSDGRLTRVDIHRALARSGIPEVFRQIILEGIDPFTETHPLIIIPRLLEGICLTAEEP